MPTGKPVIREFRRTDKKSGDDTWYAPSGPNSTYDGPLEDHYTSSQGPDGHGPLVDDKSGASDSSSKPSGDSKPADSKPAGDSSTKEK